jgi:transposase-like protein
LQAGGKEEDAVRYPKELKQKVLARMMAPGNETVSVLAREFNVTEATLYAWRRSALAAGVAAPGDGRATEQWAGAAKFAVVLETASLAEAELSEYCRARGLFAEQVRAWRELCEAAFDPAAAGSKAASAKVDRQRIRELERDLGRKDRALAETAALLILRKKAAAIWGEDEAE